MALCNTRTSTARSEAIVTLCSTKKKRKTQRDLNQLRFIEARESSARQAHRSKHSSRFSYTSEICGFKKTVKQKRIQKSFI